MKIIKFTANIIILLAASFWLLPYIAWDAFIEDDANAIDILSGNWFLWEEK